MDNYEDGFLESQYEDQHGDPDWNTQSDGYEHEDDIDLYDEDFNPDYEDGDW